MKKDDFVNFEVGELYVVKQNVLISNCNLQIGDYFIPLEPLRANNDPLYRQRLNCEALILTKDGIKLFVCTAPDENRVYFSFFWAVEKVKNEKERD